MRGFTLLRAAVTVSCVSVALGRNLLLTNDDGWAVAQIRAQYKELTDAGFDVRRSHLTIVCIVVNLFLMRRSYCRAQLRTCQAPVHRPPLQLSSLFLASTTLVLWVRHPRDSMPATVSRSSCGSMYKLLLHVLSSVQLRQCIPVRRSIFGAAYTMFTS